MPTGVLFCGGCGPRRQRVCLSTSNRPWLSIRSSPARQELPARPGRSRTRNIMARSLPYLKAPRTSEATVKSLRVDASPRSERAFDASPFVAATRLSRRRSVGHRAARCPVVLCVVVAARLVALVQAGVAPRLKHQARRVLASERPVAACPAGAKAASGTPWRRRPHRQGSACTDSRHPLLVRLGPGIDRQQVRRQFIETVWQRTSCASNFVRVQRFQLEARNRPCGPRYWRLCCQHRSRLCAEAH
jgi:hypothetical protein